MPNRLAHETSPYLLQHKDNPVEWYPWGDEAFARAKAEDMPVLLSVGYSSCPLVPRDGPRVVRGRSDRAAGAWQTEWETLGDLFSLTHAAVTHLTDVGWPGSRYAADVR